MSKPVSPNLLNRILHEQYRSLPQYLAESWPWVHRGDEAARATLQGIIQKQQEHCRAIVDLIGRRGGSIDPGAFPTDYTDLNYLALDFVLESLVSDRQAAIARLEDYCRQCSEDPEALALVDAILQDERDHLNQLQSARARQVVPSSGNG